MGLAAVTAAERRHDDAHLIFRQFEDLRQLLLHAGGVLRGGMNHQLAARLPVGSGGMGFDVAVLHRRQRVGIFKDLFRFLKSFFDVAVFHPKYAAYVAAQREIEFLAVHARGGLVALRMQHRRAGLGGFEKIEHRRQRFVVDFDQIQSLFRNFPALSPPPARQLHRRGARAR